MALGPCRRRHRLIVNKLSALLRLADSMDVSNANPVTDATIRETKSGWQITLVGKSDLMLENWSLSKRKSLFEEVFGGNLKYIERIRMATPMTGRTKKTGNGPAPA